VSEPRDAVGRIVFATGLICILGGLASYGYGRWRQHVIERDGFPIGTLPRVAYEAVRRPDDFLTGGELLGVAGTCMIIWVQLRDAQKS
jgi:hypothetical protein